MVLQANDVRDVELLHQQMNQVDAISFWFTIFIQVRIGPDTFRVLEDQRPFLRINSNAVRLAIYVGG
jgi:hypothetical protein